MKQTIARALVAGAAAVIGLVGIGASMNPALAAGESFAGQGKQEDAGLAVAGSDALGIDGTTGEPKLLTSFKNAINWVLGLLGLIALCILLWGGFQMVTAAGDEKKYEAGFKILKQAGIGLIFIGVAALFVNAIMFIISKFAG